MSHSGIETGKEMSQRRESRRDRENQGFVYYLSWVFGLPMATFFGGTLGTGVGLFFGITTSPSEQNGATSALSDRSPGMGVALLDSMSDTARTITVWGSYIGLIIGFVVGIIILRLWWHGSHIGRIYSR